ncbi:hypothetical protein ACFQ61_34685 [Streptomyces sp. NPDC056500]|uniref:hypothetical protein n=1 Tax=Streptomyces sp. NPDC056500 TaxID=3345840 RepID=UPI003694DF5C
MRARLLLTGIALGATMLLGGAATAQAAPVPAGTSTAASELSPSAWIPVPGIYRTLAACNSMGSSSAHADWYCLQLPNGRWQLWVDDAT